MSYSHWRPGIWSGLPTQLLQGYSSLSMRPPETIDPPLAEAKNSTKLVSHRESKYMEVMQWTLSMAVADVGVSLTPE